ncbi:MAG: hypothetical protein K2X02_09775 [Alphaproteobacteria bacterium]|nr:hypothetical protein [Alphaproteobacteria bacterium]
MMFIMHISALFALSVLLGSTLLLIWSLRNKGEGSALGKAIGSIVFVFSILSLLCIGYYGLKYWAQGEFETPTGMSMEMPMRNEMMQKMMPMMMQQMMPMMMEHMGQMGNMQNMGNMGMEKGEIHHPGSQ